MKKYNVIDIETGTTPEDLGYGPKDKEFWSIPSKRKMEITCAVAHGFNEVGDTVEKTVFTNIGYSKDGFNVKNTGQDLFNFLRDAPIIIGHNIIDFDFEVIWGHFERYGLIKPMSQPYSNPDKIPDKMDDPLSYVRLSTVVDTQKGYPDGVRWPSLNILARSTIGIGKTGIGADAPIIWKDGRYSEVIEYCNTDVILARNVYAHYLKHGYVKIGYIQYTPIWPK